MGGVTNGFDSVSFSTLGHQIADTWVFRATHFPATFPNPGVTYLMPLSTGFGEDDNGFVLVDGNPIPISLVQLLTLRCISLNTSDVALLLNHAMQMVRQHSNWRFNQCALDIFMLKAVDLAINRAFGPASSKWAVVRLYQRVLWLVSVIQKHVVDVMYGLRYILFSRARLCLNKINAIRDGARVSFTSIVGKYRAKGPYCYGPSVYRYTPQVHADSFENEYAAVINRAVGTCVEPQFVFWSEFNLWWEQVYKLVLPIDQIKQVMGDVSFENWNRRFPPSRRNLQRRAYDYYLLNGLSKSDLHRCTLRKSFIKRELLLSDVELKDPRVIQGVSDLANVVLGPWIYTLTQAFKAVVKPHDNFVIACGMDALELGSWIEDKVDSSFVETDFSRFDKTISRYALEFEQSVYALFDPPRDVKRILEAQLETRGITSHGIYYEVDGTRKSGDPNTSLGNSLINLAVSLFAYCWSVGRSLDVNPANIQYDNISMLVGGDDGVLSHKTPFDSELYIKCLAGLGFEAKLLHTTYPHVSFFSSRWLPSSHGYILTPKIGRLLVKFSFSSCYQVNPRGWLRGVAYANKAIFAHVPFMSTFFERIAHLTEGNEIVPYVGHKPMMPRTVWVSDLLPSVLSVIYGVNEQDWSSLTSLFQDVSLMSVLDHPIINQMVLVDVGLPF